MKTSIARQWLPFLLSLALAASPLFAAPPASPPLPGGNLSQDKLDALDAQLKAENWAAAKTGAPHAEVPRGVEKGMAPEPGFTPARRVEGTVPAEDGARAEGRGPRWVRLQAVIDAQGRLRQPVVIGPALYHLDLSPFGKAGDLLDHDRFGEARAQGTGEALTDPAARPATGAAITRPELLRETQQKPYADGAVRFVGFGGQVVLETIIDEAGSPRDPVIRSTKGALYGFDLASLDALCRWRFKPASVNGKPVRTYYVLTTNLGSAVGARRPPSRP